MEYSGYILRVIAFVFIFIAGIFFLYRYGTRLKLPDIKKEKNGLKKVDTLYLGYKKFLSLIEYEDYFFLIGVGEKDISLIDRWKREEK